MEKHQENPDPEYLNIRWIVKAYLLAHGRTGLQTDGCSCSIDNLMPCSFPAPECYPKD